MPCIKVEEITEGEDYKGPAWMDMARQIYGENGKENYREIRHFDNGAPYVAGSTARISLTHCPGLLAIATLPDTPEVTLAEYSDRAALGIDAERCDRAQVLKVRERFLSPCEFDAIPADSVPDNILAWTVKEAVFKAALTAGLDMRYNIAINKLPAIGPATPVYDKEEFPDFDEKCYGSVTVKYPDGNERMFIVYAYRSDDFIISLAYSPRTARFNKTAR